MNSKQAKEYIKKLFSKYSHPTRGSHFVKNEYLKQWSKDGNRILTKINNGEYTLISSDKICIENYMYKIEKLDKDDLTFLKFMYKNSPDVVKQLNDKYLRDLEFVCNVIDLFKGTNLEKLSKNMMIQAGEDMQTSYERAYTDNIKNSLLSFSEEFLSNDDEKLNFSIFLFSQYLRTQKQKINLINTCKTIQKERPTCFIKNPEALWKVSIIIMTNMASFTMLCKQNLHICFVSSDEGRLLTSDQPVINIARNKELDFIKFYFPVNPKIGIIFPVKKHEVIKNNQEIINQMNNYIENEKLRFVFKKLEG